MSNYTWACFDCRIAVRREGESKAVRCPSCARPCECLGTKIPVPAKSKRKQWDRLQEDFYAARRRYLLSLERWKRRTKLDVEREIGRLESRPTNAALKAHIKMLRKCLLNGLP